TSRDGSLVLGMESSRMLAGRPASIPQRSTARHPAAGGGPPGPVESADRPGPPARSRQTQTEEREMATGKKASFDWADPLRLDDQLTEDERMVREAAREYCQGKLAPRVLEAFRNESTDPSVFREMGELGLLGPTIPENYGGPGLNYVSYGLIAREVERVDSGYRSMMSV